MKYRDNWNGEIVDIVKVRDLIKEPKKIGYYTNGEFDSIALCDGLPNIKAPNNAILYGSNNSMKYKKVKLNEYIARHKDRYIILSCIPYSYEQIEDKEKEEITINLNLNMDEYIKLLDEGKKKAQELQGIVSKLKNAKVEVKDETGEGVLIVIDGKYLLNNEEPETKDNSNRGINVTINCNIDLEAISKEIGEYVVSKVKEAMKNM